MKVNNNLIIFLRPSKIIILNNQVNVLWLDYLYI